MNETASQKSAVDDRSPDDDRPLPDEDELDASLDPVDGEAVVVPGQRPGPTEPVPR